MTDDKPCSFLKTTENSRRRKVEILELPKVNSSQKSEKGPRKNKTKINLTMNNKIHQ